MKFTRAATCASSSAATNIDGTELNFNLDTERGAMEKPNYSVQVNATRGPRRRRAAGV